MPCNALGRCNAFDRDGLEQGFRRGVQWASGVWEQTPGGALGLSVAGHHTQRQPKQSLPQAGKRHKQSSFVLRRPPTHVRGLFESFQPQRRRAQSYIGRTKKQPNCARLLTMLSRIGFV